MKRKKPTLVKATSIALILFSTTICFSQNSTTPITNVTSTTSTSKVGPDGNVKAPLSEEFMGARPKSPNLDSMQVMPYSPPAGNGDHGKKNSSDKNTSKPR